MPPLNDVITPLLRLQDIDASLDALERDAMRIPPAREALLARRKAIGDALEQAKKNLTQAQLDKKNLELDIDSQDQKVRKHTTELGGVKSNDAYKALLVEIESAKKAKAEMEDRVLVLMETIDELQKHAKQDDAAAAEQRADLEAQVAALDAREALVKKQIGDRRGERELFASSLDPATRRAYDGVRRGRAGFKALAAVEEGMICGGCRTRLTANIVNQVMKAKDVQTCENCSRLLYIVPKPTGDAAASPAAASAPASTDPA